MLQTCSRASAANRPQEPRQEGAPACDVCQRLTPLIPPRLGLMQETTSCYTGWRTGGLALRHRCIVTCSTTPYQGLETMGMCMRKDVYVYASAEGPHLLSWSGLLRLVFRGCSRLAFGAAVSAGELVLFPHSKSRWLFIK